jgi:hypothetical protein
VESLPFSIIQPLFSKIMLHVKIISQCWYFGLGEFSKKLMIGLNSKVPKFIAWTTFSSCSSFICFDIILVF